ncbi:MAG TPA: sugar ABC transporter permease [Caproicibacter sp.]|nr:sugar ABC transporter permease [Caproicibacter sp.]
MEIAGKAIKKKSKALPKLTFKNKEAGSYFIMGFANFANHQILKGLFFLAAEIGYIVFMIVKGAGLVQGLSTLGTKKQGWAIVPGKLLPVLQQGDNSMLFLLYGIASLVITGLFIVLYFVNLSSARTLILEHQLGRKPKTFAQDFRSLADEKFHGTMLTLPVLGVLFITALPIIFMILIAFTNYDSQHQVPGNLFHWVGISNFVDLLGGNQLMTSTFFHVLAWTLVWAFIATFSNYFLGIIVALMINKKEIKLKSMWRSILVTTIAIPQFISLLVMQNMFNQFGPINELLVWMGFGRIDFLLNNAWNARIVVLVVNLWIGIPYTMLITSGILMNIPAELYESAKIDGASAIQTFFKITLPYVLFVTAPYLITQFIGNLNNFNVIFLLTGGAPTTTDYYQAGKTDLLVTWLYKLTVNNYNYSLASTIGILSFVICAVVSLLTYHQTSSYKKEEDYQ